jgi:hypothetical protein
MRVRLSSGSEVMCEHVSKAEYYSEGSLDHYGCYLGGPEIRRTPFLYLQTTEIAERIVGPNSTADAELLQRAGVTVIHHSKP